MIKQYPSYNFFKKVDDDFVLVPSVLNYFGMDLAWYTKNWYNNEEMRYIIRQAENKLRSFPLLSDVTEAGVTVEQYITMTPQEFARTWAESKLKSTGGP